ncbi:MULTISPECIES: T9SS type A sorting domain-containing protein [Niastella]|uniref:T9SS type A sorting domain-containing protein n=1 Tax=Niastella soli TaxID=2821487 RepID=A0ABS3YWJ1_9BACT|nr:T9SS type A sorting domain-containing protein [Niastella soli]MBO9201536.1 T9SS type A sorting domain-containing protein [Niastella soli]
MRQIYTLLLFVLAGSFITAQAQPTVPASNIKFTSIDGGSMTISFDNGNGTYRIMVVKEGSPVTGMPENGKEYTANSNFATAGTEFTAAGEYVVLKSSWNSVTVDKLKPATTYYAAVFEYNGTGAAAKYLMIPLTGSKATVSAPDVQASNVVFSEITGNSVKLNWANGNGAGRLILARKASPVNGEPVDLKAYYPYNSGEYGTGNVINLDNYTVYRGAGNSVPISKLEPNTNYNFSFFEYNGNTTPVYFKPAFMGNITTNAGPTKPTQSIIFSSIEGSRLTVGCSPGNGSKRLIIARKGSPVTATPINGTVYTANAVFGSGQEIATGEYVVSNNNTTNLNVTNLEPGIVYYFRIFEFDETAGNFTYYLNTPTDGNKSTALPPTTIATNLTVSNITGSTATIGFTPGNGNYRLAVAKESSAVNAVPQDLTIYSGNQTFGSGTQIAPGNYSIAGQMNGAGFTLNNLKAGFTYHVGVFEFNGTNYPVYNKTPATISFSIPLEPTLAATAFSQISKDGDRVRVVWTNGNGGKRIVIARKGAAVTYKPIDGTNYTANAVFAQGTQVATGEYVVYDGTSTNVELTGLEIGATYYFAVFEYNTSDAGVNDYLTTSFLTGNAPTVSWPTIQTSGLTASNIQGTQATISFTVGNGSNRLFFMKANSPVDADPNLVSGNAGYGLAYGAVQVGSTGNYFVFRTNGVGPFTVTNLAPNTTYYVSGFEQNGSSAPAYLLPGSSFSFTTTDLPGATVPTVAASAPVVSAVDGNKFNFKWTNGNGDGRVVVMRAGSAVNFTPASATSYTANAAFGTGTNLGSDQYVVYNGTGNSVSITNLLPATTYYLTVFEYNGTGSLLRYLTSSVLNATGATAAAPSVAASNAVTATTGNNMTLSWTNGNGENRLVVVKKGSNVLAAPADLGVYPANTVFKSGAQIAVDEYVVYAGNGSTVTVTGLTPGDLYYYKVFEYNGNAAPVYNTSAVLSGSVTTGTLPVTWLYFNATQKSDKVLLSWGTSAEVNSAWFIVERSTNGIDFQEAGRVAGSEYSSSDKHYSFSEPVISQQKLYYRLKQTDKDGAYSYSKIVTLQTEEQTKVSLQPNPVQNLVRIQLPDSRQNATLTIYNASGILMHRQVISNWQSVNVQQLSTGTYYLQVQQNNKMYNLKMVKQ